MSTGFYLSKNIINYVTIMVLLSQLYASQWANMTITENQEFLGLINLYKGFYRVPLNTIDYQCYFDQKLNP